MLVRTQCACTVLGIDSLGDDPILRRPVCLGSHAVLVHVQCGMDSLGGVLIVHECLCLYARTVLVLVQLFAMDS